MSVGASRLVRAPSRLSSLCSAPRRALPLISGAGHGLGAQGLLEKWDPPSLHLGIPVFLGGSQSSSFLAHF